MKKRMILLALCAALITSACGCSAENSSQPSSDISSSSSAISEASAIESDSSSDKEDSNASSGKEDISSSSESDNSSSASADKTDSAESTSDTSAVTSTAASENSPGTTAPSSSINTSTNSVSTTATDATKPSTSAAKPSTSTAKPSTSTAKPSTSATKPVSTTVHTTSHTTSSKNQQTSDNSPQSFSKTYEAEDGSFSNDISVITSAGASGGKTVGKFGNDRSYCQISIDVPSDGIYDIVIRSMGIGSPKENDLYVDGKKVGSFSSTADKLTDYAVSAVSLNAGSHRLRVVKSWGWIELDCVTVKTGATISDSTYNVTSSLVNRNATADTKKLYSFLKDSYGKYVITGQQCDGGLNGNEFKAIKSVTGKTPALLGLDMMDYTPSRTALGATSSAVDKAIEFHKNGGIVTFCWHWNAPTEYLNSTANSSDGWWGGFYTKNSKFDIAKVMNGQDANGKKLIDRDIKEIAKQLKRLEKAGVPVIWRPLHEGSGGWFWWGAQGPDAYKKLWKYLYKELTNTYGCNNLIWVYNGQSADWYPGDEYVDIVGEDIYPGNHVYDPQVSRFKQAINYGSKTKITALTENGCIFDIDSAVSINALWCWFMTWGDEFTVNGSNYSEKYTEKSVISKMYSSKYALTLENLPSIY